ncbi:MAG: hypothetical protein KatS3mg052_2207 [Candidatus Roseilinea sp.]|nr:MAG: hypothetical protein KatS3mg052_2207 [Candidatus Roseilinea sp.]
MRSRVVLFTLLAATALAAAVAVWWLSASPAQASSPSRWSLHALHVSTSIFTDTYDAGPINNDSTGTASQIPIATCSTAFPLPNLTLYRAGITPPASDIDYYRFIPAAQRVITVVVTVQGGVSNDLSLLVQLLDATGSNVLAGGIVTYAQPITLTTYNLNLGAQFFVRVGATNPSVLNPEQKTYSLLVCQSDLTITPTSPPPPPTPTPLGAVPDAYEPNNTPQQVTQTNVSFINVGQQLTNLNFYTSALGSNGEPPIFHEGDVDWYFFYGRAGSTYRVTTAVQPGVDTELFIYRYDQLPPNNLFTNTGLVAANDDYQPLDRGSQVIFVAPYEGVYWIKLWNKDRSPRIGGQTYSLTVVELAPGTPTPTSSPTPFPGGADRFEYNGDFDSATLIAPGVKYDNLNFVPFQPPSPDTVDNDFFRMPVKQGVYYTCETLDLAGGADTNIIVYNQDRVGIGGNDDISPENKTIGRFESRFVWLSGYTGYAYILIGEVNPPRANEGQIRSYSLICNIGIPPTPTPTPNPFPPTATPPPLPPTPRPPEDTPTPFPTPRPAQNLVVRPVEPSLLQPTVAPTPTPRVLLIDVQVFNDLNRNGLLDPGEGIIGAPVRLSDERSGAPLGQAFTDSDGRVRVSIVNDGPVRVNVPLFGFSTVVDQPSATLRIGIEPLIAPPERIP